MGGTGLEPVTPSLSKRVRRSRLFAPVRLSLQTCAFGFVAFATTEPERTPAADIADTDSVASVSRRSAPRPRAVCVGNDVSMPPRRYFVLATDGSRTVELFKIEQGSDSVVIVPSLVNRTVGTT